MRTWAFVVSSLVVASACGDNLGITGGDASVDAPTADAREDAPAEDAAPGLGDADDCTDTVTTIMPGNPGPGATGPVPGWYSDDTRANGMVTVDDTIPPPPNFGCRAARFVTGATDPDPGPAKDKAQLLTFSLAGTDLSTIDTISYWTYRSSASTGGPAINLSLNVSITGDGVPTNYANLVYEPYHQSGGNDGIDEDVWQQWDATATTPGDGRWWTNKIANPAPGSQAMPIPWADFQALYPAAKILGYGFNLGSYNPNMIVAGEGLVFGNVTTDF